MNSLAQILLATASPLQYFLDKPALTHGFCNTQAVRIMIRDGLETKAAFFDTYLPEINRGGVWADSQWKNIDHYYDPATGRGIWPFGNAADSFQEYLTRALKQIRRGNCRKAAFFSDAATNRADEKRNRRVARADLFAPSRLRVK